MNGVISKLTLSLFQSMNYKLFIFLFMLCNVTVQAHLNFMKSLSAVVANLVMILRSENKAAISFMPWGLSKNIMNSKLIFSNWNKKYIFCMFIQTIIIFLSASSNNRINGKFEKYSYHCRHIYFL